MKNSPLNLAIDAIQFINESTSVNKLAGCLTVGHDRSRNDLVTYELHWGNDALKKIKTKSLIVDYGLENIGDDLNYHYVFTKPFSHEFLDVEIPEDAAFFLVLVRDIHNSEYLYTSRKLVNSEHLLPPSATTLERSLAATTGRLNQLPVSIDSLWDPTRCPPEFLPWLAWATSVDIWYDKKDDPIEESNRRRELIRKNAFVHQYKGTFAAIKQALDAFANANIEIIEWWQQTPRGVPHTFKLDLLINSTKNTGVGNADLNHRLRQVIDAIKPVRSHYTFTISTVQTAQLRMATASEAVSYKRFNMTAVV